MKSPCLTKNNGTPCDFINEDKNNDDCVNCKDRLEYVDSIDRSPSSSSPIKVIKMKPPEKPKTKVCTHPDCEFVGRPQPIDDFYDNPHTSDGKASNCKSCQKRLQKKKYKLRKATGKKVSKRDKMSGVVVLDFRDDPKLWDLIKEAAKEDMRSVEKHLSYWIKVMWEAE